jgi:hypothetical protein
MPEAGAEVENPTPDDPRESGSLRRTMLRAALVALLLLGMMVGGIAVTARISGDQTDLELQYEGFD